MENLSEQKTREKTIVISVRIPRRVKEDLEKESDLAGTSLNTLIAQILFKHSKWDVFANEIGFMSLPKPFVKAMLEKVDDDAVSAIASQVGKTAMRNTMIFMNGEISVDSLLLALDLWLEAANLQYRRNDGNGQPRYTIMHMLGSKWSLYCSTVVNSLLNELGYRTKDLTTDQDALSFTIAKPESS